MSESGVTRFIEAQDCCGSYETALAEIRNGYKCTHWIWYVFPQIAGLGHSQMSHVYGIASLQEARAYLQNDTLRHRLYEISQALLEHSDRSARDILGGIDAMKVRSCMTLFDLVAPNDVFHDVLVQFFDGKPCGRTLSMVRREVG